MKSILKSFTPFILVFFCFPTNMKAQGAVENFEREYNWENTTETKNILIAVKEGSDKLKMKFEGNISEGDLLLTAYDPEGNKVAGFSLETTKSTGTSISSGEGKGQSGITISKSDSDSENNISISTSSSGSGNNSVNISKNKSKSKSKSKSKKGKDFSVIATSSGSKRAKGIMNKLITEPQPGEWKIVIEIKNVSGTFDADIEQD